MQSSKAVLLTLACSAVIALSSVRANAEEQVVNIYNWANYIDPEVLKSFERDTGIRPIYDVYDSNETLEGKLLSGNTGYDLVVPSNNFLGHQIQAGVFRKLDKRRIPNLKELDPGLMRQLETNDPGNLHGVPYLWASTGIVYNVDKVKAALGDTPPDSWALLFEPQNMEKLAQCGVAFLDSADEVLNTALLYLGIDPNAASEADYRKAEAQLMKVRPHIAYFNSVKYTADLANGDICVALAYSGDAGQASERANEAGNGIRISYLLPKEGGKVAFDLMAIPADARHPENAEAFINYVLAPKVMARITDYVRYPNAVPASRAFMDPAAAQDPIIHPPPEAMGKLVVLKPQPQKMMRLQTRIWNRIKTGI
ncbi:polyamine ABC transporter substrate-binding protein [Pseudomonas sp. 2FG]|uniref:polyamine ABC transporter substrate-binding protein n=1 Tax=Pseudomonas sp. 2FG TaxID=2502191 RepID=UPI0010F5D9DE|nr:polyamine ABC transporter substrate-binding protein [Pseudomonas sp. 2FG]